jgi:hypothetical protein
MEGAGQFEGKEFLRTALSQIVIREGLNEIKSTRFVWRMTTKYKVGKDGGGGCKEEKGRVGDGDRDSFFF